MSRNQQDELLEGLRVRPIETLALPEVDRALLRYAENLTLAPAALNAVAVDQLRGAGLNDRAIHDACAIVSYFAFVNRIADGLGVEIEEER